MGVCSRGVMCLWGVPGMEEGALVRGGTLLGQGPRFLVGRNAPAARRDSS